MALLPGVRFLRRASVRKRRKQEQGTVLSFYHNINCKLFKIRKLSTTSKKLAGQLAREKRWGRRAGSWPACGGWRIQQKRASAQWSGQCCPRPGRAKPRGWPQFTPQAYPGLRCKRASSRPSDIPPQWRKRQRSGPQGQPLGQPGGQPPGNLAGELAWLVALTPKK